MDSHSDEEGGGKAAAHSGHVIRLAKQLVDGDHPGVLATVDRDGAPHSRWMDAVSLDEFPHLYALTSPNSRKVAQIRENPRVNWMFKTDTSSIVVNIAGRARLITDATEIERIWQLYERKSHTAFLGMDTWIDGVTVIDTHIDRIDCIMPRYGLHYPARPEDFHTLTMRTQDVV